MIYYLMGVDHKDGQCMLAVGKYYGSIKNDEYYQMAIKKGVINAMYKLGSFYREKQRYDIMINYYKMASLNNHKKAFSKLLKYYTKNNDYENIIILCHKCSKPEELIKYLEKYLNTNTSKIIPSKIYVIIESLDLEIIKNQQLFIQIIVNLLKTKMDDLKLHYEFKPDTQGFEDAKQDFYKNNLEYNKKRPLNTINIMENYFEPVKKNTKLNNLLNVLVY